MEFEERDKHLLKCPLQIQEALETSPIKNMSIVNLKQNHSRGMLVFFLDNERDANRILSIEHLGNRRVSCRMSKDSTIQQGVIGPISCPREKIEAENKIKSYMTMMEKAGNPVKSMQWIIATEDNSQKRVTENMLIEFNDAIAPEQILIGTIPYRVKPYIKEPTQCFNCQHFGHVTKYCHSQCRCVFCGERGHRKKEKKCKLTSPKCCNCGGRHQAYSKQCPTYQRERIALIIKAKNNTTIFNARELADKQKFPQLSRQQRDSTSSVTTWQRRDSNNLGTQRTNRNYHRRENFSYAGAASFHNNTRRNSTRSTTGTLANHRAESPQPQDINSLALPPPLSDRPKPQRLPDPRRTRRNETNQIQTSPSTNNKPQQWGQQPTTEDMMSDNQFHAFTSQMHLWRETMKQTLKDLLPKLIEIILKTIFVGLPSERKNDTMASQVQDTIDEYFLNQEDETSEELDEHNQTVEDHPPQNQGPSTSRPQPARRVGGQRHAQKKKKKKPPASG